MRILSIQILVIICMLFTGCGGEEAAANTSAAKKEKTSKQAPKKEEVAKEAILVLGTGDQMVFDKTELKVKEGQSVKLILKHDGKLKKAVMGHNFVLLKKGTDVDEFAMLAVDAADNEYVPESDAIIAATKMIGGGENTTITFEAPEKGTYDYVCTFPGHYTMMRGKFIVE